MQRRRLVPAAVAVIFLALALPGGASSSATASRSTCTVPADGRALLRPRLARAAFARVNDARVAAGLEPLRRATGLERAARWKAWHMAANGYRGHDDPMRGGTRSFASRFSSCGYDWRRAAENIAWGQRTAAQVVADWLESSGHRANVLSPDLHESGLAVAFDGSQLVWVQTFGAR